MYNQRTITKLAINSRVLLIFIQVFCNNIFPKHNADAFHYLSTKSQGSIDKMVQFILGGFIRWDAQYFMHIAKYGYTYENTTAFFPFYPLVVRYMALIFNYLVPFISMDSLLLITFTLLNIFLLILAASTLYKITALVFDHNVAFKTVILFCYNPASVFFIAPYTETVFCYATFKTIHLCLLLIQKYSETNRIFHITDLSCLIYISLSTIIRSNGILNVGFLTYTCLCLFFCNPKFGFRKYLSTFIMICIVSALCCLPFFLFQVYCFQRFCYDFPIDLPKTIIDDGTKHGLILPGQFSKNNQSWCYHSVPLAYSYVQEHYWNVGFLRYYELKQIPNFILAFPILFIMLKNMFAHFRHGSCKNIRDLFKLKEIFVKRKFEDQIFSSSVNVFIVHALFLTLFSTFFMHIQVSTRLLCSASPVFYWYCAYSLKMHSKIIKVYFTTYFILGTIMYSLFLPWT